MKDDEKFRGFKQKMIEDNEKNYGTEIRTRFGDSAIDDSNAKIMGLTREQHAEAEIMSSQIIDALKAAFLAGNPAGEAAQKVCALHEKWLGFYWRHYSRQAHLGLAQTYVDDPRFTRYYDEKVAPGSAAFLLEAMKIYCR